MNEVDVRVGQHVLDTRVAFRDLEPIADLVQFVFVTPANRLHIGMGMALVDWNELRAKTESNHGHVNGPTHLRCFLLVRGWKRFGKPAHREVQPSTLTGRAPYADSIFASRRRGP